MYKCGACDAIFDELGTKRTVQKLEFWGYPVEHEEFWDCCPVCGDMFFEEFTSPCEDCKENNSCYGCPHWEHYEE